MITIIISQLVQEVLPLCSQQMYISPHPQVQKAQDRGLRSADQERCSDSISEEHSLDSGQHHTCLPDSSATSCNPVAVTSCDVSETVGMAVKKIVWGDLPADGRHEQENPGWMRWCTRSSDVGAPAPAPVPAGERSRARPSRRPAPRFPPAPRGPSTHPGKQRLPTLLHLHSCEECPAWHYRPDTEVSTVVQRCFIHRT